MSDLKKKWGNKKGSEEIFLKRQKGGMRIRFFWICLLDSLFNFFIFNPGFCTQSPTLEHIGKTQEKNENSRKFRLSLIKFRIRGGEAHFQQIRDEPGSTQNNWGKRILLVFWRLLDAQKTLGSHPYLDPGNVHPYGPRLKSGGARRFAERPTYGAWQHRRARNR